MPTPRFTVAQLEDIRKQVGLDPSIRVAARKAGVAENTLVSRKRILEQYDAGQYQPRDELPKVDGRTVIPPVTSYEQAWAEWQAYIGQARTHYGTPPAKRTQKGRERIVIVGDLHVPFHDKEALAALIAREKGADTLVINGDLQDFYSVSRFTKYESVSFHEEVAQVTLVLEQLASAFPRVVIVEGNHDKPRFERQLRDRLPEEMVRVVEFLCGGNLSVIAAIAKRYPNVALASNDVAGHKVSWFAQIGDLIVTHAEKFSRVPGSTLRGIEEWLSDMDHTLGLNDWRVVIQAHTHQLAWVPWHADRLLVEGGCLCETHGYQLTARIGGRPQRRGWVTLEQHEGVTDFNSLRIVWWDAEINRAA